MLYRLNIPDLLLPWKWMDFIYVATFIHRSTLEANDKSLNKIAPENV